MSGSRPPRLHAPSRPGARIPAAVALLLALLLAGCAETRYTVTFGMDQVAPADVPQWPKAPDVPRYFYLGELTGQGNYVAVEKGTGSRLEKAVAWIVGLVPVRRTSTRLQRPMSGMVGADGRIYVTDIAAGSVFVFDEADGRLFIWSQATATRRFLAPVGIADGANGEILVTDADLGVVVRLNRDGDPLGFFGDGVLERPTGIARDAQRGLLYVSDTHAHSIRVFDDAGQLIDTLGERGEKPGQFNYPTLLAWRDGLLYVTDTMNTRVQVLDADGASRRTFGERGLQIGDFVRPKGIAADSEGNIYVTESYHDHLLIYDAQGRFLLPIGGEGRDPGRFYLPGGIWIDGRDRVFVADTFNGRVSIFQFMGS